MDRNLDIAITGAGIVGLTAALSLHAAGFRPTPSPLLGTERGPAHAYDHGNGNCIIGGYVYRGTAIPELTGKYLFGDNGTQLYYSMEYNEQTQSAGAIQQIGQGRAGTIWSSTATPRAWRIFPRRWVC